MGVVGGEISRGYQVRVWTECVESVCAHLACFGGLVLLQQLALGVFPPARPPQQRLLQGPLTGGGPFPPAAGGLFFFLLLRGDGSEHLLFYPHRAVELLRLLVAQALRVGCVA